MRTFLANLLWFCTALPDCIFFVLCLPFPELAQKITKKRRTRKRCSDILFHEPTSGTSGGTKWIPVTPLLKREFLWGINPWIVSIYLRHPLLFFRRHYWSISPAAKMNVPDHLKTKYQFNDDSSYLNPLQQFVTKQLFCVPTSLGTIADPEEHARLTLLWMLADRNLGLISIWHPSFLLILLNKAESLADELIIALETGDWKDNILHKPAPVRAMEVKKGLKEKKFIQIWPKLLQISCWDQARAAGDANTLRKMFPGVEVEGKGLLATEGIATIPWRKRKIAASLSHTLSFRTFTEQDGTSSGDYIPLEKVISGNLYSVYLTTGNGFEKYELCDVVRCTGFFSRTPYFDFCFRSGGVCDLHGEKLQTCHVEHIILELERKFAPFAFAMLIPAMNRDHYILIYESEYRSEQMIAAETERLLLMNFYYRDARFKSQLFPVQAVFCTDAMKKFRSSRHGIAGGIKNEPLYIPNNQEEWRRILDEFNAENNAIL